MNKFIKKLSEREIGFIYILLFIILGYGYNLLNIPFKLSYIISPLVTIVRIWLLIKGIIKIFSKGEQEGVINSNGVVINKNANYKESMAWIIIGILSSTSIFWLNILCELFTKQRETCGYLAIISILIILPSVIVGVICIIVGLIKLNKYFKNKKLQNII